MAVTFSHSYNPFSPPLSSTAPSSFSSSSSLGAFVLSCRPNWKIPSSSIRFLCRAAAQGLSRRSLAISFTALTLSIPGPVVLSDSDANAAILEADDDEELLERVKKDRKKRLQRQEVINSSKKETGYVQEVVFRLDKVGQAIDSNDLSTASTVLGSSINAEWVKNVNIAFAKLSSSPEEKTEADTFNSSLASLISSVQSRDVESSKKAFVTSASALEKWTSLTGLGSELKGL